MESKHIIYSIDIQLHATNTVNFVFILHINSTSKLTLLQQSYFEPSLKIHFASTLKLTWFKQFYSHSSLLLHFNSTPKLAWLKQSYSHSGLKLHFTSTPFPISSSSMAGKSARPCLCPPFYLPVKLILLPLH